MEKKASLTKREMRYNGETDTLTGLHLRVRTRDVIRYIRGGKRKTMEKNFWTKEEDEVLKQAVATGRGEGLSNEKIAKRLSEQGLMPKHTLYSTLWRISLKCPQRRGGKRKADTKIGLSNKVNKLEKLLSRRSELTAELANVKGRLDAVEADIKGMIY